MSFYAIILDFSFERSFENLLLIGIAYLLALPVAWDREVESRSAGLRTFPLVAVASCAFMLIGANTFADDMEALSRALQGIIGGIGFIGGGAILKNNDSVKGTATAASLWATGAIGAAVGFGHFEIAIMLSVIAFITLHYLKRLKATVKKSK